MVRKSHQVNVRIVGSILLTLIGLLFFSSRSENISSAYAAAGFYDPTVQTTALLSDEANTVYLGNVARRNNGVPPLRWNLQLTHAARWFSWDSVEDRSGGYCGHQDTLGGWPGDRALRFGYLGGAGAENAYCGYVTPQQAIDGWMASSGHRDNLLGPGSREIGLGYYRRGSTGPGYVTQDFGNDPIYAPVIIENEALSTASSNVSLYIYDRSTGGGFAGFAPATQMMVSNNSSFSGAAWEPYSANKTWTLDPGTGWRNVYVKTRDAFNRSMTVSDAICLGGSAPAGEIGAAQMSTTQSQVLLSDLNGGALPQVQFSLGWLADDTSGTFGKLWGNGESVADAAAWGGTAYRLYPGSGESSAWEWDTSFIKNTPMVAYVRLKVNNNTSGSQVARFAITGGSTSYGPITLLGTDFTAANQYQEFPLAFTFTPTDADPFLIFQYWGSGSADVYVDAVSIFTAPQPLTSQMTWSVPGNNYRGQGVWVRYTNGTQFSTISEATVLSSSQLTIYKSGTGSGKVTSDLSGIDCGTDCSEVYAAGTSVTLTAQPASGSTFTGWSGGGCSGTGTCTVNLTMARYVTAIFSWGQSQTFADVPPTHPYYPDIEILYANGLTGGCGTNPLRFCPDQIMNRAQAAVFMVRGAYGASFVPHPASYKFKDNWSGAAYARNWAEAMRETNLTSGCKASPLLYCPLQQLNREQAVVFGLKMKYGTNFLPPPATGTVFGDMTNPKYWATAWAEKAYADGLITSCGTLNGKPKFCPSALVTRGLGAYIIVRAKSLSMP
jgi:uncharacterized protein YkwD